MSRRIYHKPLQERGYYGEVGVLLYKAVTLFLLTECNIKGTGKPCGRFPYVLSIVMGANGENVQILYQYTCLKWTYSQMKVSSFMYYFQMLLWQCDSVILKRRTHIICLFFRNFRNGIFGREAKITSAWQANKVWTSHLSYTISNICWTLITNCKQYFDKCILLSYQLNINFSKSSSCILRSKKYYKAFIFS